MSRKAPRFLSISPPLARRVCEAQQRATQEADMTRQRALSRSHKSIAVTALVALGILVLFGNLNAATMQSGCPLSTTTAEALVLLPSVVLAAASQALETCIFNPQCLLQGLFQMLVSFWLLLFVITAALLLRAVLKGKMEQFPAPGKSFRK
jgi:hypothetical protein